MLPRPIKYDRDSYLADLRALRSRGLTVRQAAAELGMGYRTAYRLLAGARR